MIEKTIELEHKVHQVHKVHQEPMEHKVHQEPMEHKVHQEPMEHKVHQEHDGAQGPPGDDGTQGPRGPPGPAASEDAQIICEECIKYWLHFLNTGGVNDLIEGLIDAINEVNWGETTCTPPPLNTNSSVICLTQGSPSSEQTYAQLFEICEQLELALRFLVRYRFNSAASIR